MELKLKSCLFSLALLVAAAARADGAMTSSTDEDSAYHASHAGQVEDPAEPSHAHAHEDGARHDAQHAMDAADAGSGSASGEPARQDDARWNQREFLRNVWSTP